MKAALFGGCALVFLTACGGYGVSGSQSSGASSPAATPAASSSGTAGVDSGVSGEVVLGPVQPVQQIGAPNTVPVAAEVQVRAAPAAAKGQTTAAPSSLIATVATGADGKFRIALAPGSYLLTPVSATSQVSGIAVLVTITAHAYTSVVLQIDTGIR